MSKLTQKLWLATKADSLVKLGINTKVDRDMRFSTLAVRLQRLRVSQTPNGPRLRDASNLQQYLRTAEDLINSGLITAAAASQFAWTGEIYNAVKYFDEIQKRGNYESSMAYYFVLNEAGARVKEFMVIDEGTPRSEALAAWTQSSPTSLFEG